jgi:hypothetical protein
MPEVKQSPGGGSDSGRGDGGLSASMREDPGPDKMQLSWSEGAHHVPSAHRVALQEGAGHVSSHRDFILEPTEVFLFSLIHPLFMCPELSSHSECAECDLAWLMPGGSGAPSGWNSQTLPV